MRGGAVDDTAETSALSARKPRGRHPDKRLTAVGVKNLKTPGRYADGNGLYLLVDPSGAKRWVWRGAVERRSGKRSDLGLGGIQAVSLADARDKAADIRRMIRAGVNPLAERRRERVTVPTFREAAKEVHRAHSAAFRNAKHKAQWLASMEADIFPVFGDRPVNAIESADVLKALSSIWATKPETARRLKQRIKVVFDWAKASGLRSGDNPTEGLTKVLPKHRGEQKHHAALPYQAVPTFITVVRTADAIESVRLAFELLILTATRTSEVLGATWTEVDLEAKVWTIPGARMKAGREHRVPLSARVVEILTRARECADSGHYVFPGRTPAKPLSNMAFLMLLRRLKRDSITTHGFRSSFRDWAAERTNVPRAVCEAALAHTLRDKTEAAYHRTDLFDRRRELMDTWAKFATAKPADVVSIRA
jgi:integrase